MGDDNPLEGLVFICASPLKSLSSKASKTSKVFEVRGLFLLSEEEGIVSLVPFFPPVRVKEGSLTARFHCTCCVSIIKQGFSCAL